MFKKALWIGAITTVFIAGSAFSKENCPAFHFINNQGQTIGAATLKDTPSGVLVQARVEGIPEGWHAFHVHQVGKCDPPGFQSAGGHFNPTSQAHGFKSSGGHHLGDMPNVYVGSDGLFTAEFILPNVTLAAGAASLKDQDGSALVIHQQADDYQTDPAGASGDRIACAAIR